jgi:exodeoxyribonuclease V alpha subunit
LIKFSSEAEKHLASYEGFTLLRRASVEEKSALRLLNSYQDNLLSHLESSPWFFCKNNKLVVQYQDKGPYIKSPKAIVESMDTVFKSLNGVVRTPQDEIKRAYWVFSILINETHSSGHTAISKDDLIESAFSKGFYEFEVAEKLLEDVVKYGSMMQTSSVNGQLFISDYIDYQTELHILESLKSRMANMKRDIDEDKLSFQDFLTKEQVLSVTTALASKVTVITGGAGTGKTTVVESIIKNFMLHDNITIDDVALLAPSGKAKDRMQESTGYDASTAHMLIAKQRRISSVNDTPTINSKLVIIDEAGMFDSILLDNLLKIIPEDSHIVLVGDIKQLSPVQHGQPFKDMLVTDFIPSVRLSKPQRTSKESEIHQAAMLVSEGMLPQFELYNKDVTYFPAQRDDIIQGELVRTLTDNYESKFNTKLEDTVVLTPMNVGSVGTVALNKALKKIMNPSTQGSGVSFAGKGPFHVGDRIIINKNNNQKNISNGDVGVIDSINEKGTISLKLRNKEVELSGKERIAMDHAFCLSIHKTQGSEYGSVILVMSESHKRMLSPELLYTGITRAKNNFIMIGNNNAIEHACDNENRQVRTTYLQFALEKLTEPENAIDVSRSADVFKASPKPVFVVTPEETMVDDMRVPDHLQDIPLGDYENMSSPVDEQGNSMPEQNFEHLVQDKKAETKEEVKLPESQPIPTPQEKPFKVKKEFEDFSSFQF